MSDKALAEYRKGRCIELRLAGHDYERIAHEVGFSNKGTAWRVVNNALRERVDEGVEEYRETELARLDALQAALWDKAMEGDSSAVTTILKVMGHRSKLLGLETAVQEGTTTPRTVVIQGNTEEYIRGLKMVDRDSGA